ncbi:MAG: glycosyltransferase, partial [Anaerolineales bacterium]|nr:glycosyltransferase [Anaerolineales bacterium]
LALGDVAVSTKISATEGSGKLLNYMALALPTVAFDTPVSREYLAHWGAYAEPGNPTALAEALGSVLADEEKAAALGAGLRQRAIERYSWEQAGRQIMGIYDSLARQQRI